MSEQNENNEWITAGQSQSWDEQGVLIGKFIRMKTNVGTHSSNVYVLRKEDGSEIGIWGSTVIDGRFEEIPINSMVRIEALGEVKGRTGSKYKNYDIKYKLPVIQQDVSEEQIPPEFLK